MKIQVMSLTFFNSCICIVTIHGLFFPVQKKTTPLDRFYYRPDGAVFFIIHIQQIFLRQYMGYHHIILLMHHIR